MSLAPSPEKQTLAGLKNGLEVVPWGLGNNLGRSHGQGDQTEGDAEHLPQGWTMKVLPVRKPLHIYIGAKLLAQNHSKHLAIFSPRQ